jgi:hypothetical protein
VIKKIVMTGMVLMLAACGGGGGGGGSSTPAPAATITPPATSMMGKYTLSSFEIYYDNGTTIRSTDSIVKSYSGDWIIRSDNTMTQNMLFNDIQIPMVGTWSFNASTGVLHMVTTSASGMATDAAVTFSGNVLTTNTKVVTGGGYREYDHWTKTTDSTAKLATKTIEDEIKNPSGNQFGSLVGEILNSIELR